MSKALESALDAVERMSNASGVYFVDWNQAPKAKAQQSINDNKPQPRSEA